ncbi:GAF domain-containing SpoIIE family protein phosphatase [Actinocorallia sp. A-T 12471]|uniref:PP2C family protein-serine/threonine phosphatase n=1 Tax=Actinocorallia sp. A-T 12471 TaxID=3089813 RepID=UPI0029CE7A9D|nr:GAF domain-containing SpoIIE family protein phosphatase [Actinocorallia sp. A-T 12471]MDX6742657.1 GAF domain-containing SpoIIE family protein phosphatase [Actinocorallia sp. A-T 12471]
MSPPEQTIPATDPEAARHAALRRYDILDSPPDGAFDRVARLAGRWFDAPVATVSLVDADRIWFKAAHGIEGLRETGRDLGLCVSTIGQDHVRVVPDTLADPVASTHPWVTGEPGMRFYAAAPIVTADGHRLGTVSVLDVQPREVDDADLAVLRDLAAIVMDELELRLSMLRFLRAQQDARTRAASAMDELAEFAATLQQTLLPPKLPAIPGLDLACYYRTASPRDVGGDFYDVFPIYGGRWAFFLGDVCGKGPAAAVLTSLIRYTLRSAALHDPEPVSVLRALNDAMLLDAPAGRFCTAMFGTLEPHRLGGFTVCLGNGGHPAAIALLAGEPVATRLIEPGGMIIGALDEAVFATTTLRLRPGDALLLYTDGLTESHLDGADELGEDGLARHLAATGPHDARQLIDRSLTLTTTSTHRDTDDIALLSMSVPHRHLTPVT